MNETLGIVREKIRVNRNGAILIELGRIIYFFNRVNNTMFPLS